MNTLELEEHHHVRYPPFEASRWIPDALPIAIRKTTIGDFESEEEARAHLKTSAPSFTIGGEETWTLGRTYHLDGHLISYEHAEPHLEDQPYVNLVDRQRRGWYLIPNPIHNLVRRFINGVVIILLLSLFYLFISPVLILVGLPVYGLNTVRWGLLDYPALAVIVVPLIFAPLLIRVFANLGELRRQQKFLRQNPASPIISFVEPSTPKNPLRMKLDFPEWNDSWNHVDVSWRVGVLPPSREVLFETLGRSPNTQPPPGLSTDLPHHWEVGLDDGTAGGEDAPMELREAKGGLYLRPMRIMANGGTARWKKGEVLELPPPADCWPGSVHTDLLRVHWECVMRIDRAKGGALLWVQPLKVAHSAQEALVADLLLHDGRSELDLT